MFYKSLLLVCFLLSAPVAMQAELTVTIVRHGETTWNSIKRIQGQNSYYTEADGTIVPITLSEKGRAQAEALAKKLQSHTFTHCFSSDLLRAVDTALIVTQNRKLAIQFDPRLRERDRGKWAGKFESEFNQAPASLKLDTETDESMCGRLFDFLDELAANISDGSVLIIGHERVITNIVIQILSLPLKANDISMDNAGTITLRYADNAWEVLRMDGVSIPALNQVTGLS